MEMFIEMDVELINDWWHKETIPTEVLQARVVLIFKKGDKADLANYRPISLLNSIYKLYTALIQKRLADKLDQHLQITQFGFRKKRGTADALHIATLHKTNDRKGRDDEY